MVIGIKIPSPGESITEVEIANWLVENGEYVEKDQEIAEVESDKATLPLIAEDSGKIELIAKEGETIKVGAVACKIDTSMKRPEDRRLKTEDHHLRPDNTGTSVTEGRPSPSSREHRDFDDQRKTGADKKKVGSGSAVKVTPLARKMMEENNLSVEDINNGLKKITTRHVEQVLATQQSSPEESKTTRQEERKRMSSLRRKLSQRLVAVKNETAMLTTFNEVDMSLIMEMRKKYQTQFMKKHGLKLGLMSFFIKASSVALKEFPLVNSMIDGEELVTPSYVDISIAVQTEKGLMVPVIRNVDKMNLAGIEKNLKNVADKARNFKLSIEEMTGGTFTITNGGVFGSMLSTPIINPPQSAILGMHNITERPVAIKGNVEIRPMMYLALSYDHRIIDGKDSVSFLVRVKELLENPPGMLFSQNNPDKLLLEL